MAAPTPRNAAPGLKYVGSKVCAGCHAGIYKSYMQTGMGRSMQFVRANLPDIPATVHSDDLNRDFRVFRDGDAIYQAEVETLEGQTVFEAKHEVSYAIGSGANGVSFVVARPGGYLFQAPLSFYSHTNKWDLSPGFASSDVGFNRPIYDACITCHAGRPRPVAGRDGLFETPPFKELVIGCENCHGAGELHVAERVEGTKLIPDDSIVNPARLPARLAEDICLKCHQGGDARALLPGKDYADFRPGTPLIDTVAVVSLPLSAANSDLLQHHVSMKLSACYRKSGGRLSCLTCHDPHVEPSAQTAPAFFRSRCFTCHNDQSCKLPKPARAESRNDCIGCHMPKRDVRQIAHAALTNHTIPRQTDAVPRDLALPESGARGLDGLLLLDADGLGGPLPLVTRLSLYGELSGRSSHLLARYLTLLDEAQKKSPDDPLVLAILGVKRLSDKQPDAAEILAKAAAGPKPSEATLSNYSEALDAAGKPDAALAALERAAAAFPYSKEIAKRQILHYVQLRRYTDARAALTRYVSKFPEDDFMRGLLAKVTNGG